MNSSVHIVVSGRVQGVYFRANAQKQAVKLHLKGYVKNLETGEVEIVACGHSEALQALIAWCHKGPLLAKVSQVVTTPLTGNPGFLDFEIR